MTYFRIIEEKRTEFEKLKSSIQTENLTIADKIDIMHSFSAIFYNLSAIEGFLKRSKIE